LRIGAHVSGFIRNIAHNSAIYLLYEKILWNQIKEGDFPDHIGIILDGNRRWARERYIPPWEGHASGADKVEELLDWCLDLKIRTITLYVFSVANFLRSPGEIKGLMDLVHQRLNKILHDPRIHNNEVSVRIIGRLNRLPKRTQQLVRRVEKATANYAHFYLNLALAYGGRAEIVDATRKIADEVRQGKLEVHAIDERVIEEHLYTAHLPKSEPDLIIRSSGEERLSDFLVWQGAYSELCFIDTFWPEFRKIDLMRAVRTYQGRKRRYGR
jgi:tritrans,polycis-undecaprenyl-diphosphate synthase [geranylgeranyl-diphosphate specific]